MKWPIPDIGKRLLEKFAEDCTEVATMDKEPKLGWTRMTMFLFLPKNDAKEKTKNKFNDKGVFRHA